jgi:hypothetical protein
MLRFCLINFMETDDLVDLGIRERTRSITECLKEPNYENMDKNEVRSSGEV